MDQGASMKLSLLVVVLVALASFLSPFIAEARQKHMHHCNNGHHGRVKLSPLAPSSPLASTTVPTPSPSPYDGVAPPLPSFESPQSSTDDHVSESEPPSPTPPTYSPSDDIVTPPPAVIVNSPPWYETPPYVHVPHGCGYGPCVDSNDCDWPCTVCCSSNQTCCYDYAPDYY